MPELKSGSTVDALKMGWQVGVAMASDDLEQGWDAAEKLIKDGDFKDALVNLRSLDEKGEHAKTWKLAADCKKGLAQEEGGKKAYRQAVKHYRQALKIDPKYKDARIGLEGLQGEMTSTGIRERMIPKMIDDGTPTLFGIIMLPLLLLGALAVVKMIADGTLTSNSGEYDYIAVVNVEWTDDEGVVHNDAITIELYYDAAPITVQNWIDHANAGNYDGIRFHRVIDGFMLQTGDIEGMDGTGGYAYEFHGLCNGQEQASCDQSDYTIPDEFTNGLNHQGGALAMAHGGPGTGGSQFYFVDKGAAPSHLDWDSSKDLDSFGDCKKQDTNGNSQSCHTVFGQVTAGMNIIDAMGQVQTAAQDKPVNGMVMTSIDIDSQEKKGLLDYLMFWTLF